MASAASSQHRCVFVGNIPYDATEEQLVQICEEVGPVVSFRLVLDRETGKPKGYGFCEYKDEETALSARRNLQGYEINGRQLRVDFAENDKGADRNREQGRGGPGLSSNIDAQKSLPGPPILGDSNLHQPVGLPLAATAASVMARALSGAQSTSLPSIQNGLQSLSGLGNDPLTHYLAKMSRYQLNEIMSEMKALATQNKPLARQLLQGSSQLPKALFQAQIMLGLVNPQMMQLASNRQSSSSVLQPSLQDHIPDQKTVVPSHLGQTPSQKEAMVAMFSRPPENQMSSVLPNSLAVPVQNVLTQPLFLNPSRPQAMIPGTSGVTTIPPLQPQSLGSLNIQLPTPSLPTSKGLISQIQPQPPLLQHPRPTEAANISHPHLVLPSTSLQKSVLPRAPTSQNSSSKRTGTSGSATHDLTLAPRTNSHSSLGVGLMEQTGKAGDMSELMSHPSKRPRLEDASVAPQVMSNSSLIKSASVKPIPTSSLSGSQTDWMQHSEKQMPQLPPEVESALLQQVMSLTPEQLSSLPPEQQQQVLQLQQMLR